MTQQINHQPTQQATAPLHMPLTPPTRPGKFSGLATAAMVLGIVGVVFSLVPILDVITMLGAIVGAILGAIALTGTSKTRAGIGAGLCVLAVIFTAVAMNSFTTAVDKAVTTPNVAGIPPAPPTPPAATPATPAPAAPAGPATSIGDGTHVVGEDIEPGTYKTSGAAPNVIQVCYWARLKSTDGDFAAIITNGTAEGPTTVTIKKGDAAFKTSGCNTWQKVK